MSEGGFFQKMNSIKAVTNMLFDELELAVKTTTNLLLKIEDKQWGFRPTKNMRSLEELVHHLIAIPRSDLTCLMLEKSMEEYEKVEKEIAEVNDREKLGEMMKENLSVLKNYVNSLSEDELLNKKTKPFYYEQGGHVQIKWLMEIVTHTYHHRAQLFNYLKQLNHPVNMFDLY